MTWFEVSDESTATVDADRERVWAILSDPDKLVKLTPFLKNIDADGDTWVWRLGAVQAVGNRISPCFTEHMTFKDESLIEFEHAPPQASKEMAGVDGSYSLSDADGGGTDLDIAFTVKVRLPVPKLAKPAVHAAVKTVLATMGNGFAKNLQKELAR